MQPRDKQHHVPCQSVLLLKTQPLCFLILWSMVRTASTGMKQQTAFGCKDYCESTALATPKSERRNRQIGFASLCSGVTADLQFGMEEMLRGLRNFRREGALDQHSADRLKGKEVEKGCGRRSTHIDREQPVFNQIIIDTVSRATLRWLLLLMGCLTSQQHASVSQVRICSDNCKSYHTKIEIKDQTCFLTQLQYTVTGLTMLSTGPVTPGTWQGSQPEC